MESELNTIIKCSVVVLALISGAISANHGHFKDRQTGEYYEYDLDRTEDKIRFHSKQVLKAPFKACAWSYRSGKSGLRKTVKAIELFLSDSRSINGQRQQLKKAMAGFEGQMFEDYYGINNRSKKSDGLLYVPKKAWRILRNTLFVVGFRFPRATWKTIKSMVYGATSCFTG